MNNIMNGQFMTILTSNNQIKIEKNELDSLFDQFSYDLAKVTHEEKCYLSLYRLLSGLKARLRLQIELNTINSDIKKNDKINFYTYLAIYRLEDELYLPQKKAN